MNEDFRRIEAKIDKINEQLTQIQVRQRDVAWIKNTAKLLIPFVVAFCVWVTSSIMELQTNVATLPPLQRDKSERSDNPIK